jgi:hypothetical protein
MPPIPEMQEMWLVALGQGMFYLVAVNDGQPVDVMSGGVLEFTPLDGRTTKFEIRGPGDQLMATGWRVDR